MVAAHDVYLRSVPSDANSHDVRLYDPTLADSGGVAVNYTLACDAGIFAFTGATRLFSVGRRLTADAGAFGFTGSTRLFRTGRFLVAAPGSFAFTGAARTFSHGRSMTMEPGSFAFTGQDETFSFFDAPRPLYRGKWIVS